MVSTGHNAFAELKRRYRASLPDKLREIQALWASLEASGSTREILDALRRRLHQLAGSAGPYGFPELSDTAARLETLVASLLLEREEPANTWPKEAVDAMSELSDLLRRHSAPPP